MNAFASATELTAANIKANNPVVFLGCQRRHIDIEIDIDIGKDTDIEIEIEIVKVKEKEADKTLLLFFTNDNKADD